MGAISVIGLLRTTFRQFLVPALLILTLVLPGCASLSGYPKESGNPDKELAALEQYFDPSIIAEYNKEPDVGRRRQIRDTVIYGRLHSYDINFKAFEKALASNNNMFSIGSDVAVLALNAVGTVTGGAPTKAVLHAASAGIVGTKDAVDKDLFYQKTLPALIAAMKARRLTSLVPIEKGLGKPDAEYSLHRALIDLSAYDSAGSIPGAISQIVSSAGAEASAAQAQLTFARDSTFLAALPVAKSIGDRIKALKDSQALMLAKTMDDNIKKRPKALVDLMHNIDPNDRRLTDGATAKQVLLQWQAFDDRDEVSLKQWTDALNIIEKS